MKASQKHLYFNRKLSSMLRAGLLYDVSRNKMTRIKAFKCMKFIDCCLSEPIVNRRWKKVWDGESSKNSLLTWPLNLPYLIKPLEKYMYTTINLTKMSKLGFVAEVELIRDFLSKNHREELFTYQLIFPREALIRCGYLKTYKRMVASLNGGKALLGWLSIIRASPGDIIIIIHSDNKLFNLTDVIYELLISCKYPNYIEQEILKCTFISYMLLKTKRFLKIKKESTGKLRCAFDEILPSLGLEKDDKNRVYVRKCLKRDLPLVFPTKKFHIHRSKKRSMTIKWRNKQN